MTQLVGQTQLVRQGQMQAFVRNLGQRNTTSLATSSERLALRKRLEATLRCFLTCPTGAETAEGHGALISEPEMFNTNFNRILISSLANGCAGLQDVPIGSVLKHLMRYRHTSSVLLEFLEHSETHVAKGLAENLFRAAIDAQDVAALQIILRIPSVDVNKILCFPSGNESRGLEPILRAAKLECLDMVRALRKAGAVVDKSKRTSENLRPYSDMFFDHYYRPNTKNSSAVVDIAKELLLAGLEITYEDLHEATYPYFYIDGRRLQSSFRGDFIFPLALGLAKHSHANFFLPGSQCYRTGDAEKPSCLIYGMMERLKDDQAATITHNLIGICTQDHGGACLNQTDVMGWALTAAAKHGKLEVVELLLPYTKDSLHRAFTAAIRSRSAEVVDAILAHDPDIDAPAHCLEFPKVESCYHVTAFSEAVTTGNDSIIQMIQDRGYFDRLEHGSRFHPAVTAAAKTNDLGLLRSLLERYRHPHPAELGPALIQALKYGNEESARTLLDSGASTSLWHFRGTDWNILLDAVAGRNSDMVYALLDAAHEQAQIRNHGFRPILHEAVVWGDEPILTALFTTFPSMLLENEELAETLENNNLATFNFLLASKRVTPSAITRSLEYAIEKGSETLTKTFLDLGADCTDEMVLEKAAGASLSVLKLVLGRFSTPQTGRLAVPRIGVYAMKQAIEKGTQGLPLVECLLQSDAIDHCSVSVEDVYRNCYAPLSIAIEQCCEDDGDDLRVVKLFLNAGHSANIVVRSKYILDLDTPGVGTSYYEKGYLSNLTALLLSIEWNNLNLVKLFLDYNANVNLPATCRILRTPLQKACEVGSLEIVRLLLDRGADPNGKPARCQGATALQLAAISGNCNIAAELLDRGADLHQPPVKAGGRWPLEGAAEHGRLEMIEFLWKASGRGFDKLMCDFAMEAAERRGHLACRDLIKDLMENGVSDQVWDGSELMDHVFDVS